MDPISSKYPDLVPEEAQQVFHTAGQQMVPNRLRLSAAGAVVITVMALLIWGVAASRTAQAHVASAPTAPFMAAGATAIDVTPLGRDDWQFSYQLPPTPSTSYTDLVEQLEQDGWRSSDERDHGPLNRTYLRTSSWGLGEVREWVFVRLDPSQTRIAQLSLRRVVVFPWWQRLSRTAERWQNIAWIIQPLKEQ